MIHRVPQGHFGNESLLNSPLLRKETPETIEMQGPHGDIWSGTP